MALSLIIVISGDETDLGGRPSKYKPQFNSQASKLCSLGATDQELADFFNVSLSTLNLWKETHPRFSEVIKESKRALDEQVERSLFQRAIGYNHEDVDIRAVALGNNQGSEIVKTPIVKYYPPSEVACIFWLKNRQRDKWRDRQDVVMQNPDGSAFRQTLVIALSQAITSGQVVIPNQVQDAPKPIADVTGAIAEEVKQ